MSGFDANFRNLGTGDLSTFNGDGDHDGDGNVLNIPPFLEPFMDLACGTTTSWELRPQVGFAFWRSPSLPQNQKYNARQGNFVIDGVGPVDITVTATGFTPFVSLVRNNSVSTQATDGSGVLTHTVTSDEIGPWTVEVTSLEPYAKGVFTIQISCTTPPPAPTITTLAITSGGQYEDAPMTLVATVKSSTTFPLGSVTFSHSVHGVLGTAPLVLGPFVAPYAESIATLVVAAKTITGPRPFGGSFLPVTTTLTADYAGGVMGGYTFVASSGTASLSLQPIVTITIPSPDNVGNGPCYWIDTLHYVGSTAAITWAGSSAPGPGFWRLSTAGGGTFPSGYVYDAPANSGGPFPPNPVAWSSDIPSLTFYLADSSGTIAIVVAGPL